jgi:septum formation protein
VLPLILASASPRRRELLRAAGLDFEVLPADVNEDLPARGDPERLARELALRKARAAAERVAALDPRRACLVLGADTVVAVPLADGGAPRLLAKPADEREAHAMLELLSDTRHAVVTGVAVVRLPSRAEQADSERTWVRMRAITQEERADYVASGEWRGKAGGYAIQESADRFVTGLDGGGFDNVVGLPVGLARELLQRAAR